MNNDDASRYFDIIHLPHHQSARHSHMSMAERAAQFSPFAALTGYEDCIRETARATERRIEPDDGEKAVIDSRLALLHTQLAKAPRQAIPGVRVEYFVADPRKDGGEYIALTGAVQKIDVAAQFILMADGTRIPMADILSLETDAFSPDGNV